MKKKLFKEYIKVYCDHCNKELESVWVCNLDSSIGTRYALLCTSCQKLIGIYTSIEFTGSLKTSNSILCEFKTQLN